MISKDGKVIACGKSEDGHGLDTITADLIDL